MTALVLRRAVPRSRRFVAGLLPALAVTATAFGFGLLLADRPILGMIAALAVLALVVSLAVPSAATVVVIAILYSNAAAVAVRDHSLPQFVAIAFPLVLALPLADQLLLRRKPVVITSALPYLFGYLFAEVIATIGARDTADATDSLVGFLLSGFGLYFVMTNLLRTFASLRGAVWVTLIVAAAIGALTTFQALTGTYGNDYGGFATIDLPGKDVKGEQLLASTRGTPRSSGPVGETNRYGQVMLVLIPIGAMLALGERRRRLKQLAVLLTLLILLGMVTTFSRGAFLGLVVVFGIAILFRYVRVTHLALLAVTLAVTLVAFPKLGERLGELQALTTVEQSDATSQAVGDTGNLRGRATSAYAALLVWADHPLFGVGRGQFQQYYEKYAGLVAQSSSINARVDLGESRQAHNLYTSVGAETGTVGLIFFMGVFIVTLVNLGRARRRWLTLRPEVAHLATGFFLALVAYLVSGIALHLSYERYLWFLLALAGSAAYLALNGDPDRDLEVGGGDGPLETGTASTLGNRLAAVRRALPAWVDTA